MTGDAFEYLPRCHLVPDPVDCIISGAVRLRQGVSGKPWSRLFLISPCDIKSCRRLDIPTDSRSCCLPCYEKGRHRMRHATERIHAEMPGDIAEAGTRRSPGNALAIY